MDEYLIKKATLADITDAINAKTGEAEPLSPLDMPDKIAAISTGAATQDELDAIAGKVGGITTPSTPASIEAQSDDLIADANAATGGSDTTLTDAVGTLIAGQASYPEAKYNSAGQIYTEHVVVPDEITSLGVSAYAIDGIKSINLNNVSSADHYVCGRNSSSIVSIVCPKITSISYYLCSNCEGLMTVELGSIGYPVTSLSIGTWLGTTSGRESGGFTVTIYVDATRIDDIPESVRTNAMGGSGAYCSAVIYRNSTTGEVLT